MPWPATFCVGGWPTRDPLDEPFLFRHRYLVRGAVALEPAAPIGRRVEGTQVVDVTLGFVSVGAELFSVLHALRSAGAGRGTYSVSRQHAKCSTTTLPSPHRRAFQPRFRSARRPTSWGETRSRLSADMYGTRPVGRG